MELTRKINKNTKAFFRNWEDIYERENLHSRALFEPKLSRIAFNELKQIIKLCGSTEYYQINHLSNLAYIIEKYYRSNYSLPDDNIYVSAKFLFDTYHEDMLRYFNRRDRMATIIRHYEIPYHNGTEAFKELVVRGFVPLNQTEMIRSSDIFVTGTINTLIYPRKLTSIGEGLELIKRIGIKGYVGLNEPLDKS